MDPNIFQLLEMMKGNGVDPDIGQLMMMMGAGGGSRGELGQPDASQITDLMKGMAFDNGFLQIMNAAKAANERGPPQVAAYSLLPRRDQCLIFDSVS